MSDLLTRLNQIDPKQNGKLIDSTAIWFLKISERLIWLILTISDITNHINEITNCDDTDVAFDITDDLLDKIGSPVEVGDDDGDREGDTEDATNGT